MCRRIGFPGQLLSRSSLPTSQWEAGSAAKIVLKAIWPRLQTPGISARDSSSLLSEQRKSGQLYFTKTLLTANKFGKIFSIFATVLKVGVLRASHKIFNSEVRICWNDASKFSSISSSQLTFCCVFK
jgi:hypothetical protein